jgi:transglutaminase-like putative cysteine protease
MRISVVHSTVYRFDNPVFLERHTFRLRPREDAAQRLLQYAIEIQPAPVSQTPCLDQDGNAAVEAWFQGNTTELSVRTAFQIETLRENPFDFIFAGPYDDRLRAALAPFLVTDNCPSLLELAPQPSGTLDFLAALNANLYQNFEHVFRNDGEPFTPEVTMRRRSGSCRDVAVLFCAACRARGLAARFVSGYERASAFDEEGQMHAWAEVYLPGGGWRGYDPSRGLAVTTDHVAVATAAHPSLAAPVAGTYRGSAQSKMEYAISMQAA